MLHYLRRLILAFCFSAACYYATEDWYQRNKVSVTNTGEQEPIALLVELTDEVQRKPLTRVIWETISKDENLFAGEAIRTSSKSEAKILLLKSETVIELEPDSVIVLEETERGFSLNFLKGHLFLKSSRKNGSALALKAGKNKINLQNADIFLSKTKQDGPVDVQVYGGTAQIKQGKKTITIDETQSGTLSQNGMDISKHHIQVLSPQPGSAVYIDPRTREKVVFQWKKISTDYEVYVERGKKRSQMMRNPNVKALGTAGKLAIGSKVGKFYWRLIAQPKKPELPILSSAIIPFSIVAKRPPVPLKPDNQAQLVIEKTNPVVRIKWVNPAKLKKMMVEVATDSRLKNQLIQEVLDDKLKFADIPLENSGTYYWRLTGFIETKDKPIPISSEIRSFQVQMEVELVPPVLHSPAAQQPISLTQVLTKGLFISWKPVPGIPSYELNLERGATRDRHPASTQELSSLTFTPILTQEVKNSPVKLNNLTSGVYRWTIRSLNAEGKKSEPAAHRAFVITEISQLAWAKGPEPEKYYYYTGRPSMFVRWLKGKDPNVIQWRYRVAPEGMKLSEAKWKLTQKPQVQQYMEREGNWQVQVEALDTKNRPIARSTVKTVTVTPKPLLPSPNFADNLPEVLKANRKGNLSLQWDPVDGAKKYKVILKNKPGKVVKSKTLTSTNLKLNRLKPGDYQVFIHAVDKHNRTGPEGLGRKLEVPRTSNIKAPKLKTIQVK